MAAALAISTRSGLLAPLVCGLTEYWALPASAGCIVR